MKLRKSSYVNKNTLNCLREQCKVFADNENNLQLIYEDLKEEEPNYLINLLSESQIRELEHEGIIELEVR